MVGRAEGEKGETSKTARRLETRYERAVSMRTEGGWAKTGNCLLLRVERRRSKGNCRKFASDDFIKASPTLNPFAVRRELQKKTRVGGTMKNNSSSNFSALRNLIPKSSL